MIFILIFMEIVCNSIFKQYWIRYRGMYKYYLCSILLHIIKSLYQHVRIIQIIYSCKFCTEQLYSQRYVRVDVAKICLLCIFEYKR